MASDAAPVSDDSEDALVSRARTALSRCNWVIGECASRWTKRYSRGRTDADFGQMIGLSGDQVYQRRRVWDTFGDVHERYENLKWSHFYAALTWDDAAECLQWAEEMDATVAEMKAWRRSEHGEDLDSIAADDELPPFEVMGDHVTGTHAVVRDPDEFEPGQGTRGDRAAGERQETASAVAHDRNSGEYAPFGKDARGEAPAALAERERPGPTAEQIFKKIVTSLERCDRALSPELLSLIDDVPEGLKERFVEAVESLSAKAEEL